MSEYHRTLTASAYGEHRQDLLHAATRSRLIAELPVQNRHHTPRQRVAWWGRVTGYVTGQSAAAQA